MSRRSSKTKSSRKAGFANWLRDRFESSTESTRDGRRLQFEYLESRQLLSVAPASGPEFQVNTYTTGNQQAAKVASDAAGAYVVVWESAGQDGSLNGIYAQRYSAAGAAQGSEFQVNTYTTNTQADPAVAMDSAGDFVVTWQSYSEDGSSYGVYAQLYNASGAAQGSEFRANTYTTSQQSHPSVAMDSAGDFVIAWESLGEDGNSYGIYAQRFNAGGIVLGVEFKINTYTTGGQSLPSVAMDSAGDFVIAWTSLGQDGASGGIYAQRYNSVAVPQGSEFRVNTYTTGNQTLASVALDSEGDFVVAWESYAEDGSGYGVYAQRYSSTGVAQGVQFQVNTYTKGLQGLPSVAMDSVGDFVVAWQSYAEDGSEASVYAQQYNSTGVAQGSEFRVNTYTTAQQASPSVAMDSAGDFVVAWQSYGEDGSSYGVYAQRYVEQRPSTVGGQFQVNTYTTGDQAFPKVASDSAGDYVIAWESYGADGSGYGIFAQRYSSNGAAQGSEFEVNTYTTGIQRFASVAMDSAGDFVIVWESFGQAQANEYDSYAQRYNSSGVAQGSNFLVNSYTTGGQSHPSVAMDATGDFVIAWQSFGQDGSNAGIEAQRFNSGGTAQGAEFQVNQITANDQLMPSAATDAAGDFVIAFESLTTDGSDEGVFAQRYNAAGTAQGGEFQVNTYTTGNQEEPSAAMDAAGDFIIAWQSLGQDGSDYGVYAQRYNSSGNTQGAEFQVNSYTLGNQQAPSVAMDSAGDFVISWESNTEDGSQYGIYAQQYNSSGVTQGNEFRVNSYTTGGQFVPAVAIDATGDFVVAWESYNEDGSAYGIYAQRYAALKPATVGNQFQVNTYTTGSQEFPRVASDSAGDYVIVWESYGEDGSTFGIFAQRYNSTGTAQGSEFQVNTYTTGEQRLPAVAMDSAGDFVVAWQSLGQDGSANYGIYSQRYNSSGVAQGSEFLVNGYTTDALRDVTVAMDSAGAFVIAWDNFGEDGNEDGVYAQRFNASGTAQGAAFQVNTYTTNDQFMPSAAMDSAGDFVIAWQSDTQDGSLEGVYAQRYNSSGTAQGVEFRVNTYTTGNQEYASVAMDSAGDFVVAWETAYEDGSGYGVFAQRYNSSGATQGSEFQVNTYTPANQVAPSVAMDSAGSFVIAWESNNEDGSGDGIYAQQYSSTGLAQNEEFRVNTYTTGNQNIPAVAMDSTGDFIITWDSIEDGSDYGVYAQRYGSAASTSTTVSITGSANDLVLITFSDATDFTVTIDGGTPTAYNTASTNKFVYNGPAGAFSEVIFSDPVKTDDYTDTQSLAFNTLLRSGFEFDASGVYYLYIYGSDPSSTATVNVANGGSTSSNFFVGAANGGYSYIANPIQGIYSELSGFPSETVTGSAGSTYAYVYSTTDATFSGAPASSTLTVGSATETLSSFPQVYAVGAADGSDSMTLQTGGGSFVGQPSFSYVSGTASGAPFLIGALYAANVTTQATNPTDSAFFYSYANDTFNGSQGTSSLSGSSTNVKGSTFQFVSQATGFQSLAVLESGADTDIANLTSPGNGVFTETPTVSTLVVGTVTVITVDTDFNNGSSFVAVPSKVYVTGNSNGTDTANLYDYTGNNTLVAQGNNATLDSSANTVSVTQFGKVNAFQTLGTSDTVHQQSIDFALQTVGNWMSV